MTRVITAVGYAVESILLFLAIHFVWVAQLLPGWNMLVTGSAIAVFLFFNILSDFRQRPTLRLKVLSDGRILLIQFLVTTGCSLVLVILTFCGVVPGKDMGSWFFVRWIGMIILMETVLFWNGIIRVYVFSVQLELKWRLIGILAGMIPIVHLIVLIKIIRIVSAEVEMETQKQELNAVRKTDSICQTKYPLLLVHGVFFRDVRFYQYWGRIPKELVKNGATVFYGNQQSAASAAVNGEQLAQRIREIVKQTGCEKVNIIAHSKGGLDCRYAVSRAGAAPMVASLTTICTPHHGCLFADYLLQRIPAKVCQGVALRYNRTLRKLGDHDPNFMEAVDNLTGTFCEKFNKEVPDAEGVYYQSVGAVMQRPKSGRFPLNMAYPLVKHFDGANDGLVSLESSRWGENFIALQSTGKRGISHGDVIDLNRENIKGFDVREFYVNLVQQLKQRGL